MNLFLFNLKTKLFAFLKIPLIFFVGPQILKLSSESIEVRIPFKRRNKNHVGSLYFGALAVGADMCVGVLAMHHIQLQQSDVVLIFKDFKCDYKKQARGATHFFCHEGKTIAKLVTEATTTGIRQNAVITGYATVPSVSAEAVVAEFTLTLSLKKRS